MIAIPNMDKPKSCKVCPFTCEKLAFFDGKNRPQGCPIIDIVTCGECKHHDEDGWGYGECKRPSVDYLRTADEDFCSYGERRSE